MINKSQYQVLQTKIQTPCRVKCNLLHPKLKPLIYCIKKRNVVFGQMQRNGNVMQQTLQYNHDYTVYSNNGCKVMSRLQYSYTAKLTEAQLKSVGIKRLITSNQMSTASNKSLTHDYRHNDAPSYDGHAHIRRFVARSYNYV